MAQDTLAYPATPRAGALAQRRNRKKTAGKDGQADTLSFWRMIRLLYPHRRPLIAGLVLGMGVALTYAASLGGMLPVLKVVVEQESLHTWLVEKASKRPGWYTGPVLRFAELFPAGDTPVIRMQSLVTLLAMLLGINLLGNVCRCFSQYLVLYACNRAMMDLRRRMFRKALHVPMLDLSAEVSNRVSQFMSDSREIFMGLTTLFGKVAREPLKAVCVLAVALILDARLTLVVIAVGPIAVGILWYFGKRIRKAAIRLLEGYGLMLGSLEETLQGIDTVKGYAREGYERRRMWGLERRMLRQQLRLAWIEAFSSPLIEVVGVFVSAAAIVWLASQTFAGKMETSHFITMIALIAAMLDPVRKVASVYNNVQRSGGAATRVFGFLDQPEEHSGPDARDLPAVAPRQARAVRFENVTFRYTPQQEPPALDAVSLDVRAGECIAIVGPNGSGKSTLVKLLPRLIEPQSGAVRIDGLKLDGLSLRSLRREIAVVSQRPVIFARSVRDNIAYGYDTADMERIRTAARQAYASEFVEAWPNGYETVLGEFGASISGGQRQRLSIARAFLKPASILIFDEATSEIDADSERKIHDALHELRQGKTTFLIAHRHTVMDLAERIVVMDAGKIVDVGTHEELMARSPLYVALYRSPAK